MRHYVNLVKTTFSDEVPLILIFRLSDSDVAETFWENFNKGDLQTTIKTKLQSFPEEMNCFYKDKDIQFDIVIDPDDYQKVYHTLQNPEECKSWTQHKIDCNCSFVTGSTPCICVFCSNP